MSTDQGNGGGGRAETLGYTGGWEPVVALIDALEQAEPHATRDLLREAHRAGLVTSFDWPTWMTGRGRELRGDPAAIAAATLEECRRLLVAHLRRDRFVTDHLADVIASGEVTAILRRAEVLTAEKAVAPRPPTLPLTTTSPRPPSETRGDGAPQAHQARPTGPMSARPIHPDDAVEARPVNSA